MVLVRHRRQSPRARWRAMDETIHTTQQQFGCPCPRTGCPYAILNLWPGLALGSPHPRGNPQTTARPMNSPTAWLRRGGGFRGEPLRFLVRRPLRGKPRASRVLCDLPRRRFGPFRPYFPKNPRGSVRLGQRIAREQFRDAAFRDDHGGIVVRVVPMSAALTDELGLTGPVVPML